MPEQQRSLVRLRDRYPTASRMTRYRMRQESDFPDGIDVLGTEYFYDDELEAYEEKRRRRKARPASGAEGEGEAAETTAKVQPSTEADTSPFEQILMLLPKLTAIERQTLVDIINTPDSPPRPPSDGSPDLPDCPRKKTAEREPTPGNADADAGVAS